MAVRSDITPELCRQLLDYDPDTGELTWLPRDAAMFGDSECNGGVRTAAWQTARWNTRYSGQPAFTSIDSTGYRSGRILNITFRAHRVIWAIAHGYWPDVIDHIDGDTTNNRLRNLRNVDTATNAVNTARPSNNTSGHVGVYRRFNKWVAQINHNGTTRRIGAYDTIGEAVAARAAESQRLGFHENHGR